MEEKNKGSGEEIKDERDRDGAAEDVKGYAEEAKDEMDKEGAAEDVKDSAEEADAETPSISDKREMSENPDSLFA